MNFKKYATMLAIILLIPGGIYFYQQAQASKYEGMTFIPEQSDDVPLYRGLKAESPIYKIKGNKWEDIMVFYQQELPKNGWAEEMMQVSSDFSDGAGFISTWRKEHQGWELSIRAAFYKNTNQTEVLFDKKEPKQAFDWIKGEPSEICINEQPDRSDECYPIIESEVILKIAELINSASEADMEQIPYNEKSIIEIGPLKIEVYYDLEKGIYLVSEKGEKWMKPETEFFQLTRISKEY
ncbi:hypothetical protein [Mesobacillus subterraneus]|uniref:Uncharacterized protein n=1 Tax=Mesobacillus subterraneus TaxID=285983 RepID=A0A427TM71_9BACI|nr:hypothetical protein [Mesobacillus subterraneus]RSD25437.1 hypothetical protein EJA10_16650 [Mesobacillus subterraneus]